MSSVLSLLQALLGYTSCDAEKCPAFSSMRKDYFNTAMTQNRYQRHVTSRSDTESSVGSLNSD